jgi:hypothetical protein
VSNFQNLPATTTTINKYGGENKLVYVDANCYPNCSNGVAPQPKQQLTLKQLIAEEKTEITSLEG